MAGVSVRIDPFGLDHLPKQDEPVLVEGMDLLR